MKFWKLKKKKLIFPFIVECDLGFYGNDCKKTCNYPFYGSNCVFECNCSKEECHFKNGCRDHHIKGLFFTRNNARLHMLKFTVKTVWSFVTAFYHILYLGEKNQNSLSKINPSFKNVKNGKANDNDKIKDY